MNTKFPREAPIVLRFDRRHPQEARLADQLRYEQSRAVQGRLGDEPTAQGLRQAVEEARLFGEAAASRHRDPAGPPVACRTGCSACCHQTVRILAPEAFAIAYHLIHELPDTERARVLKRLNERDVATCGMAPRALQGSPLACAFLDEDGGCSIYSVRPLTCAGFSSYDVEECERNRVNGFEPGDVPQERARMMAFYAVQQGFADGLAASLPSADVAGLELTRAVVDTLAQPEAEAAWMRGAPVFARARLDAPEAERNGEKSGGRPW